VKTSETGIHLIKFFEGVRYKPYMCSGNVWTVGCGHALYPRQLAMNLADRAKFDLKPEDNREWTKEEVDGLLKHDIQRFELGVLRLLGTLQPTQSEFDALVSFSFNLGLGTFQRSTVRSAFIRGDKTRAGEVLLKYCRAGGRVLKGLQRRRMAEHAMFMSGA
jgi:lysozyme